MTVFRRFALVSVLAIGAASIASAQAAPAAKCDVDDSKPNQVKDARNAIDMIDLLAAADSAFGVVEALGAECAKVTDQYRRALYAPLVNAAVPLYNSQTPAGIDSAMAVSRRALIIYRDRPLSYIAYNI